MLLGTLVASLLGNILAGTGINKAEKRRRRGMNRAGEEVLRVGYGSRSSKMNF